MLLGCLRGMLILQLLKFLFFFGFGGLWKEPMVLFYFIFSVIEFMPFILVDAAMKLHQVVFYLDVWLPIYFSLLVLNFVVGNYCGVSILLLLVFNSIHNYWLCSHPSV